MKVNIAGLHRGQNSDEITYAFQIKGDADTITITKHRAYTEWVTNTTPMGDITMGEANMRHLQDLLGQWLRGEEPDVYE